MSLGIKSLEERCQAFISSNFIESPQPAKSPPLAVAISRLSDSGSHDVAEELIRLLEKDAKLGIQNWALFDRDLVGRILKDHNLPKRLETYMPEDRDHDLTGVINEILGVHPSQWKLFHYTCDTIHKLAKTGNVILIGRGSHIITRNLPHVLHVRIIAPFDIRARRASKRLDVSLEKAQKYIRQEDAAREAYVRSHFNESLENPGNYDLTLNMGHLTVNQAARILKAAILHVPQIAKSTSFTAN